MPQMNKVRYCSIMYGTEKLTPEEINDGWHFCPKWDLLLVGPDMPELEACTCKKESK